MVKLHVTTHKLSTSKELRVKVVCCVFDDEQCKCRNRAWIIVSMKTDRLRLKKINFVFFEKMRTGKLKRQTRKN
jgi:hypothetical protein